MGEVLLKVLFVVSLPQHCHPGGSLYARTAPMPSHRVIKLSTAILAVNDSSDIGSYDEHNIWKSSHISVAVFLYIDTK